MTDIAGGDGEAALRGDNRWVVSVYGGGQGEAVLQYDR